MTTLPDLDGINDDADDESEYRQIKDHLNRYDNPSCLGFGSDVAKSLSDPGGGYLVRIRRMAFVGVAGTLLAALGFWIGGQAWGYAVLVIFIATVVAGLAIHFGLQAFTAATLLNAWVLITLFVAAGVTKTHPWNQALAWLVGSAIAVALMSCTWLLRADHDNLRPYQRSRLMLQ